MSESVAHAELTASPYQKNPLILLSYLTIAGLWGASQVVPIPYVPHLLCLVTAILYVACHASLILREIDPATGKSAAGGEVMKKEDAMQFPLLGSASLFSLYLAFKFLDPEIVNLLIGIYFGVVGCLAMTATFSPWISVHGKEFKFHWDIPLVGPVDLEFTVTELILFVLSGIFCGFYYKTRSWAMNNVLGICFCIQGIERFSLGTYKIGAILLVGLFFYDIFWVFGTDVMVTVAKKIDGPIKILFPRSLERNADGKLDLSLLGLGDIVIPGFFLALLLRFDAHNAAVSTATTNVHHAFPKPYFHSALIAYVLGLATTLFVMIKFNAAQPALLYLVPACLGSSWICALVRGELAALFAYSEEEEEEEEETSDDKKEESAKKDD
jgi:minor histocompatibility antigen H13